jgi:hypothetical protein
VRSGPADSGRRRLTRRIFYPLLLISMVVVADLTAAAPSASADTTPTASDQTLEFRVTPHFSYGPDARCPAGRQVVFLYGLDEHPAGYAVICTVRNGGTVTIDEGGDGIFVERADALSTVITVTTPRGRIEATPGASMLRGPLEDLKPAFAGPDACWVNGLVELHLAVARFTDCGGPITAATGAYSGRTGWLSYHALHSVAGDGTILADDPLTITISFD